jgi:hypothetical protein
MTEWKLVPVEPTEEMSRSGSVQTEVGGDWRAGSTLNDAEASTCYTAMLAAAPKASEDAELVWKAAQSMCRRRNPHCIAYGDACLNATCDVHTEARAVLKMLEGNHD